MSVQVTQPDRWLRDFFHVALMSPGYSSRGVDRRYGPTGPEVLGTQLREPSLPSQPSQTPEEPDLALPTWMTPREARTLEGRKCPSVDESCLGPDQITWLTLTTFIKGGHKHRASIKEHCSMRKSGKRTTHGTHASAGVSGMTSMM